jgi:hypothetical protein
MWYFNLEECSYWEPNDPFSTLKIVISLKYSLQTLTQLSQAHKVLVMSGSNIEAFLWTDTCVSSTQLN